jgi:hypothetical protein
MKSCRCSPPRRFGPTTTRSVVPSLRRQDLERIAEVIVVELIIADAVKAHRCNWRHHEKERGAHRSCVGKRRQQTTGRD